MKLGKSLGVQIPFGSNSNSPIGRALQTLYTPDKIDYTAYGCLIQHCSDQHLVTPAKQLHARLFLFSVTSDNFLASKLVSFYSKTNHLCGARYVFDKIPRKNVFSWNAMLIGCSHQGMHHEALQFFSSLAFSNDIDPDRYNITCVLKVMSSLFSDSQSAKVVHCFILRRGLDLDIFVLNAFITYYSRCEELGLARAVFDRMPQRDSVSWNAMIAGYSQSGFYVECKHLYKHMLDVRGPRPNGVTLVSVLQACGQSKDLILGMVHRLITDRGIQMDTSICNTLIALYAKCGSLDYALELFKGMNEKDEVTYGSLVSGYIVYGVVDKAMDVFPELKMAVLSTWNAVISGLCQSKQLEQAIDLVREMQAPGFRVNTATVSSILPIFSQLSYLREAKSIHAYAVKHGYNRNIYVATAIIDTYAKLGFIHDAKCVFDQAEGRSLVIWTSIITAYGGHGDANVAQSLFYKMIEDGIQPDGVNGVVVSPVQVCLFITKKRLSSLQFLQQQVSPSRHFSSQTQKRRIESTRFATALRVLDVIKPKKPTSYEKPQAQTQTHLRLIEDILQTTTPTDDQIPDDVLQSSDPETDGVAIDSSVLSYAVSSCGSKRDLLGGRQYHCLAVTSGFVANVYVGSSLISLYSRCAMLEDAYGVFEEMPVRNVVSWTAIIAGYAQECQIHACSMLFHRMRSSELQPNDFTFTSLLSACTGSGAIGQGRSLHAQIIHMGYHSYVRILNALMTVYYKCGTLQDALYIFRNMDGKDIVSWNSMIAGYAQHGHAIEAINLFSKMKRQHIKPDAFTYLGVLSSCRHAGLVEEGKGYFNSMVEHGVKAELDHYSCVVDLLGRAGLLSEALEFIRRMPVCPNAVIWGSLLSSCQLHGSVWIGIQAAESKMLLEPECPATILQLANLYASVGWWDKAASVRRMMKERGMKTNPGNSWIEIRNRVFRFGVDDGSNTRIFCILELMDSLKDHMRSSRSEFELLDEEVEMLSLQ